MRSTLDDTGPLRSRHPRWLTDVFVAGWVLVAAVGTLIGFQLGDSARDQWGALPGTESAAHRDRLFETGAGGNGVAAVVYGDPDDPGIRADVTDAVRDVERIPGVVNVVSWPTSNLSQVVATDRRSSAVIVWLAAGERNEVRHVAAIVEQRLLWVPSAERVVVSNEPFYDDVVSSFVAADNQIARPATLTALLVVLLFGFWGFRRLLLFIPVAVTATAVAWLVMWVAAQVVPVPRLSIQLVAPVTTVLTGLLWRQTLTVYPRTVPTKLPVAIAVTVAVPAAGLFVTTSDATVHAVGLCAMAASVGFIAVAVGLWPSWTRWAAPWLIDPPPRLFQHRHIGAVRIVASALFVALVGVAAVGVLGVKFRAPSTDDLPAGTPPREVVSELHSQYSGVPVGTITVLADVASSDAQVEPFVASLSRVPGLTKVAVRPLFGVTDPDLTLIDVTADPKHDPVPIIESIKATPAGFGFTVGGDYSEVTDRTAENRLNVLVLIAAVVTLMVAATAAGQNITAGVTAGVGASAVLAATAGTAGWVFATGNGALISDYAGTLRLDFYTPYYVTMLVWPVVASTMMYMAVYPRRKVTAVAWLTAGFAAVFFMGVLATGRTTKEWAVVAAAGAVYSAAVAVLLSRPAGVTGDDTDLVVDLDVTDRQQPATAMSTLTAGRT